MTAGFGNIMFFNMILYPICEKILANGPQGQPPSTQQLIKAAGVFALFVSVSVGIEVQGWEPNHFQVLGVHRDATNREIKNAYREMSKTMHPDVSSAPDAEEQFMNLGKAKEFLSSESDRRVYDRFGEHFASSPHHDRWLEEPASMAFYHISYYGSALFLTFVLTFGTTRARAKWWCFLLLAAVGFYELMAKYDDKDWDFFMLVLPSWTLYQKIEVIHSVTIYVFHLLAQYASSTYIDIQAMHFSKIHNEMAMIMMSIASLEEEIEQVARKKSKAAEGSEGAVKDGAAMARKQKVQKFKMGNALKQQGGPPPQQQQGTNWLSLLITGIFLYQWVFGEK